MKCLFQIADCEVHSFSYDPIDSRMYALISGNKALVVDPCVNENARDLLRKREIGEILVLPTHEHYDHISGINWLRDLFSCKVLANEKCASNMLNPLYNASAHFEALFIFASEEVKKKIGDQKIQPYSCGVDESFAKHKKFSWQNHSVRIHHTPGHSQGSCCIFFDEQFIFLPERGFRPSTGRRL